MKTYKFGRRLLAAMSALVLAIGCGDKSQLDPTPTPPAPVKDPVINLDAASVGVTAQSGSGSMGISIENAVSGETVKAVSDASWLVVTGATSSSVAFKYEENTQTDSRSAKITVNYGKAQAKAFTVRQEGAVSTEEPKKPVINLMTPSVKLSFEGGEFELQVEIENPVEGAKLSAESSDWWLQIDGVTDSKVLAHCGANYTVDDRSGVITLSYPGAESQTATVEQATMPLPPVVNVTGPSGTIPAEGGSFEILLQIENPTEGVSIVMENAPAWVTIESVSNEKIVGSCGSNPYDYARSGEVQFYYEGAAHYSVTVRQDAGKGSEPEPLKPVIHFDFDEAHFPFREMPFIIVYRIENPCEGAKIEVKSDQDWLEVEDVDDYRIFCTAHANSGPERTGMLTVTYPDAETRYFPVTQEGVPENRPVLVTSIPQDRHAAPWGGEVFDFNVSAEGVSADELYAGLTLTSDSDWISPAGLPDEKVCRLYIARNEEPVARTGHVTLYFGVAEPKVIEVVQGAEEKDKPWIYVERDLFDNLSSHGDSMWLIYHVWNSVPGGKLTYRSDQSWLTVDAQTDEHLTVSYDKNPLEKERIAHLTLSYPGAEDVTVTFRQEAYRYLKPVIILSSTSHRDASYSGGSYGLSFTIENFTDISLLKITSDSDWISIKGYDRSYLDYAIEENERFTTRTGHITFSYEGADDAVFTITQEAQPRMSSRMEVTDHTKYHQPEGTENGVTKVTVIYPWDEYELTAASSDDAVCRINGVVLKSQSKDFNEYEVRYTVSANPTHADRSATITLKYGDLKQVLDIEQYSTAKPVIIPETTSIHVPFSGVTGQRLQYQIRNTVSGARLTVDSKSSWIRATSISDFDIYFDVDPNTVASARRATVYLQYADADKVGITFEQDAWVPEPYFGFVDGSVVMNKYGDPVTVKIAMENFDASDFSSFSMSSGWFAIDGFDLTRKTMTFRAEQNTTGSTRNLDATVTMALKSGKRLSAGIRIVQEARDLILGHDRNAIDVDADEHTEVIRFTPETRFDDYVSVKGAPSWITTSRSGDNITLKIARNTGAAGRSATLTFSYYHHADVNIVVTQKGKSDLPADVVDLGLPSGKLWTTMNMGASKPSDSGTFYAWGEVTGKTNYTWDTYSWTSEWMKYPGRETLELFDDPAARFLGSDYRMPTINDFLELEEYCNLAEETLNGVKGLRVTNRKDRSKSIFIPYSGYKDGTTVKSKGNGLSLWTNSRYGKDLEAVMVVGDSEQISGIARARYLGAPVRAVYIP